MVGRPRWSAFALHLTHGDREEVSPARHSTLGEDQGKCRHALRKPLWFVRYTPKTTAYRTRFTFLVVRGTRTKVLTIQRVCSGCRRQLMMALV